MILNNNLSPLPFYGSLEYLDCRKRYAFGNSINLRTLDQTLLPFQIIRPTSVATVQSVIANAVDGSWSVDITSAVQSTGLTIERFEALNYDVICYSPSGLLNTTPLKGRFTVTLSDGIQIWYSDVLEWAKKCDKDLVLKWSNEEDIIFDQGRVVYSNGFENVLYICADISRPEYIFEEEGAKRDGYFFAEKQISTKKYKFVFLAPEHVCDLLRTVRLSDTVTILQDGITYRCDQFVPEVKWQEQGNIASVEVEFTCDTVIKKIRSYGAGDYNRDYNEDYNI